MLELDQVARAVWSPLDIDGSLYVVAFETPIANYYMTDPISRASETMAACTTSFVTAPPARTGTDA